MNDNKENFSFSYSALTDKERKEINAIRNKYAPTSDASKSIETLRALNKRVHSVPIAMAITFGTIGTLIFGLGMAMVLEWSITLYGILVSATGLIPTALAYPVYKSSLKKMKKKYGKQILELSESILKNND